MGTKEDAKIIRKALKKLCPTFSVRMARGTAYGWIDVWCGDGWEFSKQEKEALETFGLNYGGNSAVISPESRQFWVRRARQILEGKTDRKYLKERKVAFISVRPAIFFFPKDEFLVNGQVPKDKRVPGSFIVPMDEYIFWFTSTFVPLDVAYVFYNRGLEISFIDSKGEEHLFLNQENKRPIPTGSAEIQNNN